MKFPRLSKVLICVGLFCLYSVGTFAQFQRNTGDAAVNFPGLTTALKWIIDLDLSADQVSRMVVLFKENHTAVTNLNKQLKEQAKEFRNSFDPATFDEAKTRTFAAGQAKITEELILRRFKFGAGIYAIFTPEQREKIAPLLKRLKEMGRKGHARGQKNRMGFPNQMNWGFNDDRRPQYPQPGFPPPGFPPPGFPPPGN